ncbi:MAG TPA: hypothetical protein VJM15_00885 [Sphingomicrobium sp.]|nr:hypothetical protein [Sphingomicrobium sp.]
MRALTETLALELVERGVGLSPLDRAVLLVATIDGVSSKRAGELPLDQRDRRLIDACIQSFGSRIVFFARCPECREGHEAEFDLSDLPTVGVREVECEIDGRVVRLSPPTSRSVAKAAVAGDPAALLRSCVQNVPARPAADFAAKIEAQLADSFPLLDISFELRCEACKTAFNSRFDVGEWLWRQVCDLAQRAVDAVHTLARAYGWSERQILRMSPARRAMYLARVLS